MTTKKTTPKKTLKKETIKVPGPLRGVLAAFENENKKNENSRLVAALDNLGDRVYAGFTHLVSALAGHQNAMMRLLADHQTATTRIFDEMRQHMPVRRMNRADGLFDVVLLSCGPTKIYAIKTIREFTGLDLREAKDLCDRAPSTVLKGVSLEKAEQCAKALREHGATTQVDGDPAKAPASHKGTRMIAFAGCARPCVPAIVTSSRSSRNG
jgi:ribosomal protein L7/L12